MQLTSPLTQEELYAAAAKIKVLLMDVDGVLTDGRLLFIPGPDGSMVETKAFDSQDGIALRWLRRYGLRSGVISGRNSPATTERARQAEMNWVIQGHIEKIPHFEKIMAEAQVTPEEVAYIGDDFTDVVLFRRVGLSFATANARPEVKSAANATTIAPGGAGAVREVIEVLLKAQGVWDAVLKHYEVVI